MKKIKKVVLVNPMSTFHETLFGPVIDWREMNPPIGLCYLAAAVREAGYDVSIVDSEALRYSVDETMKEIKKLEPDLVGITCKTLWIMNAHEIAERVKKEIGVPVVAGGNHPTAIPERTIKEFPHFDTLVVGEGEVTFVELLKALSDGSDLSAVKGIVFRKKDGFEITPPRERNMNIDSLPVPAWDLLPKLSKFYRPSLAYTTKLPGFVIVTSRGCPGKCMFCDRSTYGNRVTRHSPEYVVNMIRELKQKYGVKFFEIFDDNFLLSRQHLFAVLDLLEKEKIKIRFTVQSRVDTIDEERLTRLKKAGCEVIFFGVESGSQEMLKAMNKGVQIEQIRKAFKMTRKFGIKASANFILGFPGESEETLKETESFIKELDILDASIFYFTPLPGSEIYEKINSLGNYKEDWDKADGMISSNIIFVPPGLKEDTMREYHIKCMDACYNLKNQFKYIPMRLSTFTHVKAVYAALIRGIKQNWRSGFRQENA